MTTESVHVHEQAKIIANLVVASHDILVEGVVHAMCICGGTVRITSNAELKGGIRAAQLIIEPGAKIEGSIIESQSKALGTLDVDAASRSKPGTGPAAQIEFKSTILASKKMNQMIEPKDDHPFFIHPSHPPRLRVVR